MQWHTIDPALPALPLALDATAVHDLFSQAGPGTPALLAPDAVVQECRCQGVHYSPASRCVATYRLVVAAAGAAPYQTIGVVEATPAGLSRRHFADDPHLPALTTATAPAAMQERFAALGAATGQAGEVERCTVTPLRYKPTARCALRYDVQTRRGALRCFGKMVVQQSAHLAQTITLLAQESQQEPALPRIAQPLAYWPDLDLVLQAAVSGTELHTAAFDEQLDVAVRNNWFQQAGRAVAALHSLSESAYTTAVAARQTLTDDLAGLDAYHAALHQINPSLAARVAGAAVAIAEQSAHHPEEDAVVSHGALRTDQFLLDQCHLVLIDLDSVCWASPARDLGNFLAYLTWKALRQPHHAAFIEQARTAFLAGYQTMRTLPAAEWLARYQAAALLKIIGRRYTGLTALEWPLTEPLLDIAISLFTV